MSSWKEAFQVAKFELRHSILGLLGALLFITIFSIVFALSTNLATNVIAIDLILMWFTFIPIWVRPKDIQFQKVNENGLWVSPSIMIQLSIPIPVDILIKSRLIIYFIYALPIYISLLVNMYLFSNSMQEITSIGYYLIFIMIWLAFYLTFGLPVGDIGQKITPLTTTVSIVTLSVGAVGLIYLFHFILDFGIVYGTILLVQNWPFLSIALAIIVGLSSVLVNTRYMKRQIKKIDYL